MEILFILFQISIFFVITSIGISLNFKKKNLNIKVLNPVDNYIFNVLIHINFILLLSFLNLKINQIIICYFTFISLVLFINFGKIKKYYKSIKLYFFSFFIIFFITLIISVDISNQIVLGWDAQKFWFYKTINFYDNGNLESLKNLDKGDGYDYPFLGSLLWSIFWNVSILNEEYFGRLFYVFLYVISLISIVDKIKTDHRFKITLFLILILITYNYEIFNGEQDIILFCLLGFMTSTIIRLSENSSKNFTNLDLFKIILICNLLVWTKAEGFVYSVIIVFSILCVFKIKFNKQVFLTSALLLILFIRFAVYKFYGLNIGVNSCCWNDLSPSGIISKISLERIILITKYFIFSILKNYIIIFSLLLLIISKKNLNFLIQNLCNNLIIFFSLSFIFTAYLLTDIDLVFMLKTGLDRLLFSISPFFIAIIVKYINNNNKYFR